MQLHQSPISSGVRRPSGRQLLNALALAQLIDRHGIGHGPAGGFAVDGAYRTLLDVRTELHPGVGPRTRPPAGQSADEISAALGFGDRFDLAHCQCAAPSVTTPEAGLRTAAVHCAAARAASRPGAAAKAATARRMSSSMPAKIVLARCAEPEHGPGLVLQWPS